MPRSGLNASFACETLYDLVPEEVIDHSLVPSPRTRPLYLVVLLLCKFVLKEST